MSLWLREGCRVKICQDDLKMFCVSNLTGIKLLSFWLADAPKTATLSASPSAKVDEGSPVTLNCNSDANPATYIWYKENQNVSEGAQSNYVISRITLKDGGNYHCKCVNQHGEKTSAHVLVNVQCEWRTSFILCSVPMNYPSINPSIRHSLLWPGTAGEQCLECECSVHPNKSYF